LWAGHAGNTKKFNGVGVNRPEDGSDGIVFQIAVDNFVFFTAFQHGRKREHGERKAAVARFSGSGMKEDDHSVALAAWIRKRDGILSCVRVAMWDRCFLCTELKIRMWSAQGEQ
jgi:hypothetical protein